MTCDDDGACAFITVFVIVFLPVCFFEIGVAGQREPQVRQAPAVADTSCKSNYLPAFAAASC